MSQIWEGQRFPPEALTTVDGRAVEVVHPGRRGGSAGPDFVDAVLLLDGVERRGDVELHVRSSLFQAHGHATDPAYANLALHVVYRADQGAETRLCGGGRAPVAAFAPWLERRGAELSGWLAAPSMWQEPCRGALQGLGAAAVRRELEAAGRRRFAAKVQRLRRQVAEAGAEEALWRGLLDTLGVGGDREGFRRLAVVFPARLAYRVDTGELEAVLLYVAGLGERPDGATLLPEPLRPALRANGRPANHPRRRLGGLAALYGRADGQTSRQAEGHLAGMARATVRDATSTRELVALWEVAGAIGAARAQEIVVNVVLPFAALRGRGERSCRLLAELPAAPGYGRTSFLESNLRPARGRIVRNALQQQGLLGLIGEWCSQGGCGRCPLS